jgi:hypothetical protein
MIIEYVTFNLCGGYLAQINPKSVINGRVPHILLIYGLIQQ